MKKYFLLTLFFVPIFSCTKENDLRHQTGLTTLPIQPFAENAKAASKQHADVINGVTGAVVGSASLTRTESGIQATFAANDATPGFAYTMWWVIWNNPDKCSQQYGCVDADFGNPEVGVQIIYGGGNVSGGSGKISISGHLKEGDVDGNVNDLFGLADAVGIDDATHVEVHLVLRNHGPAVPGEVNEQINTYLGGCLTNLGLFTEIPDEVGECGDTHVAVFASPDAP